MVYAAIALAIVMLLSAGYRKIKQGNVIPLVGSAIALCVFAGLRDISFGPDLYGYRNRYLYYVPYVDYGSIWMQYKQGIIKDGLFYVLMKLFADLGCSYQLFIALVTAFYTFSVTFLISKKSDQPIISFMMFMVLSWFQFSFTGLRQSVAMGLCAIALVVLLENRKSVVACLLIFIAGFCHSSAWIFLVAPAVAYLNIRINRRGFVLLSVLSIVIATEGGSFLRNVITAMAWNDSLANYAASDVSLNWTGFIIQIMFAAVSYFFYDAVVSSDEDNAFLYTLMALGVALQAFSAVVAEMFRISMYFSITSICIYPQAIKSIRRKDYQSIAISLSVIVLVLYFFKGEKFIAYTPII